MSSPPTTQIGTDAPFTSAGITGWNTFVGDNLEKSPALQWPMSIDTYNQMRSDAQVQGLYMGTTLPVRRYRWRVDPNGCAAEQVQQLAADVGIPIKGQEEGPKLRSRGRFSFKLHLQEALLALVYGHYPFEQVGEIGDDGLWHLRKLAPLPPSTISAINMDGGAIASVIQMYSRNVIGMPQPIPIDRMVWYPWMKEGANWVGRSLLRSCYRHWLRKDRLLRVDANKHERNGMGIPVAEAPPGASGPALDSLDRMMRRMRGGDMAGGAIPSGARVSLKGVEGQVPDTIASMRFDNEEMARSWLMMFMQLGQTETGSRALGTEFIDFFADAVDEVCGWFADVFNAHVIEDWWDWNVDPEADSTPLLVFERSPDPSFAGRDLAQLVAQGAITLDEELENAIRQRYGLPARAAGDPPPTKPVQPAPSPPAGDGTTARRQRRTVAAGTTSPVPLPDRPLRRQPYEQEVAAKVDFAEMDLAWQSRRDALTAEVRQLQSRQVEQLHDAIAGAGNDPTVLAGISADPVAYDALRRSMIDMATTGMHQAITEASRQGIAPDIPNLDTFTSSLESRAKAIDEVLASALSQSARANAVRIAQGTLTASEVAGEVADHLRNLSDTYLRDMLGNAITAAMNTGRNATIARNATNATRIYASEILDDATCPACIGVDGTEYVALSDAEGDYPGGGFKDCFGGGRCRGSLIAVYNESVATLE